VVHCGESRAQRIVGVKPCAASRLARHNRVERTIHDSPRPIRGWGHQNPKCQPEAHAHQFPSGLIVSAISAHADIAVSNRAPRTANMMPMASIEFTVGTPSSRSGGQSCSSMTRPSKRGTTIAGARCFPKGPSTRAQRRALLVEMHAVACDDDELPQCIFALFTTGIPASRRTRARRPFGPR